jgi:hypothetical protein
MEVKTMSGIRKTIGFILIIIGILLSLTALGAIIGIPMIIVGAIIFFIGQK